MAGLQQQQQQQPPPPGRSAVTLQAVLSRKDAARISAVAVDAGGGRFFLGLDNGHLEEHRLVRARQGGLLSRFSAEKRLFKKGIADVCLCLAAQRLLLLSEDHVVAMCAMETFDVALLPGVKQAAAIACEATKRLPARVAVATLGVKKKARLLLFSVAPGMAAAPSGTAPLLLAAQAALPDAAVQQLAWVGPNIVVAVTGAYWLYRGGDALVELSSHLPCAPLAAPVPHGSDALLLFSDRLALLTDSSGAATREPLLLPSRPLALGHAGGFCVAVCDEGVHVYDRNTTQQVQAMDFMHDDPWVEVNKRIACSSELGGGCVLLASSQVVWVVEAVPLEEQVAELLRRHRFPAALDVIHSCAREGAPWAPAAYAEAGLLMLQDLQFEDGMAALERCTPFPFQPLELFPLFPQYTAPWLPRVPHKRYWGLATSGLMELGALIEESIEVQRGARSTGGVTELGSARDGSALAVVPFNLLGRPEALRQVVLQLQLSAERCVITYLRKVREVAGVDVLDGVDTLLAQLLCATDAVQQLEEFACAPQQVAVEEVAAALEAAGHWHALALFSRQAGRAHEALSIWQRLGLGGVEERPSASGAVAAAGGDAASVAARHSVELLRQEEGGVDAATVLHYLPWLLQHDPDLSFSVLQVRDLPVAQVQGMLDGREDHLRWRFLEHVVQKVGSREPPLHTQLASNLVEAVLRAQGRAEAAGASSDSNGTASSSGRQGAEAAHVQVLRKRLQAHLSSSSLYDARVLLGMVEGSTLWQEQVELYRVLAAHTSALRVLALTLCDVDGALLYCRQYAGQEGFLTLLELFLNPGESRQPLYAAALRVLDAEGAELNPIKVLHALSDTMPLHLAMDTLSRMLASALHRRRHLMLLRSLHRAQNLSARLDKLQHASQRVVVSDETTCRACQRLLGNKVFYRYPSGLVICNRCFKEPEQPSANGGSAVAVQSPE